MFTAEASEQLDASLLSQSLNYCLCMVQRSMPSLSLIDLPGLRELGPMREDSLQLIKDYLADETTTPLSVPGPSCQLDLACILDQATGLCMHAQVSINLHM